MSACLQYVHTRFECVGLSFVVLLSPVISHAMPRPNLNNGALQSLHSGAVGQPDLRGAEFMLDDAPDKRIIYVSPATHKTEAGVYAGLASPRCEMLENQYRLTYALPETDYRETATQGPFSPYFDLNYGNFVFYGDLLAKIDGAVAAEDALIAKHRRVFEEFIKNEILYQEAQEQEKIAQQVLDNASAARERAMLAISAASSVAERRAAQEQFNLVRDELNTAIRKASKGLLEKQRERAELLPRYAEAKAAWQPYAVDHTRLTERRRSLQESAETMRQFAQTSFDYSDALLSRMENAVVGRASAAYTLYDREVERALTLKASHRELDGYSIQPLEIVNVSMGSNQTFAHHEWSITDETKATTGEHTTQQMGGAETVGSVTTLLPTAFATSDGKAQAPVRSLNNSDGAGTFNALVTRGAFCTGDSARRMEAVEYQDAPVKRNYMFTRGKYAPRRNPVLAQAVAVNYDYYVSADPINVKCKLDWSSAVKFMNNSGESKNLFNASRWNNTDTASHVNRIFDCDVAVARPGVDEDGAAQQGSMAALRQSMQQEMAAEFISTFASSWNVTTHSFAGISPAGIGDVVERKPAALALCGSAFYCRVGGIVWFAARDIFGGSTSASTRVSESTAGTMVRNYSQHSYRKVRAQARISLTVKTEI